MSVKRNILKWLGIAFWMSVTIGTSVLLVAAVRSRNARLCKDVQLTIHGPADGLFLNKQEILKLLTSIGGPLTGRPMEEMDLNRMEDSLRRTVWLDTRAGWRQRGLRTFSTAMTGLPKCVTQSATLPNSLSC